MKKQSHIIPFALIIALFGSACSTYYMSKADRNYEILAYAKATKSYEKALRKEDDPVALLKLANAYRLRNEHAQAELSYAKLDKLYDLGDKDRLNYACVLMSLKKYTEAASILDEMLTKDPSNEIAQDLFFSCEGDQSFYADTTLFTLTPIQFDGLENCFSAVPFGNSFVFAADEATSVTDKAYNWTGNSYLDIYSAKKDGNGNWASYEKLNGTVNGKFHEGPATFSADMRTIYFTRTNAEERKLKKDTASVVHFKLFQATLNDKGEWDNINEFTFNSDDYSTGHPALSEDGKTLYFVSDMPGGNGGTDIYVSHHVSGAWTIPENLGSNINSQGNEMFPFVKNDVLYFSSTGHFNMGGLDVFRSNLMNGKWKEPTNMLYPINTSSDDMAYVLSKNGQSGFVSSNRVGKDMIYEFDKHAPTLFVEGRILSAATSQTLPGVEVRLRNLDLGEEYTILTGADGSYSFSLLPEQNYRVLGSKDGLFTRSEDVSTVDQFISKTYNVDLYLDEIIPDKAIAIKNIYYDYDSWDLRPEAGIELNKLVRLFTDNPEIVFEVGSHTDSRASDMYNFLLSDMRAKSAVDYLIYHGVDPDMIVAKGYGERRLANRCFNGVECSEVEHQENRRTEFKVIKINTIP